jgi:hypothetical protein
MNFLLATCVISLYAFVSGQSECPLRKMRAVVVCVEFVVVLASSEKMLVGFSPAIELKDSGEIAALKELFASTNGDTWFITNLWNTSGKKIQY